MATMNVSVPDPMRDWVQAQIENGKYASVSDYVRDLIRRDQAELGNRARWLATLDAALTQGVADAEAGRGKAANEVFDRLEDKYRRMVDARDAP